MKNDFFYKTYHNRLKRDKIGLTFTEKGIYTDLVDLQFEIDRFTEKDAKKALGKSFYRHWEKMKEILKCYDGYYYIEWLDDVIYERDAKIKKISDAATATWKIRKKIREGSKEIGLRNNR